MSIGLDLGPGCGPHLVGARVVNSLVWLSAVAIIMAFVAVVGFQPTGARPVARTRLMAVARLALLGLIALGAYLVFR